MSTAASRRVPTLAILWALIAAFAVAASTYAIARHMARQSTTLDLGIQTQVIWNTAQGRPFESSIEVRNYLADHLSLVLAGLAPLYWIWPDVRLLLAFQALALALGAYPVYRLARAETGEERTALLFALLYLLYPALGFILRFDFHAEALVIPLLLAALWLWKAGRLGLASLALLLALLCREETGLTIAGLGLVLALRSRGQERRLAVQWAIVGAAWSILGMALVMPHLRGEPSDTFRQCFQHLGPSYGAALGRIVSNPIGAVADSWSGLATYKATLLPRLLLPLSFLPLAAPLLLVPLLPSLAPAFFSRCLPHSTIYYQYTAPMIPVLFWAGMQGFRRVEGWLARRVRGRRHFGAREGLLLLLALGTAGALGWDFPWWKPVEGAGLYRVGRPEWPANQAAFLEAAALIPPEAALAADNYLGPQFAHRRQFYLFPAGESWRADFIILDLQTNPPTRDDFYRPLLRLLECHDPVGTLGGPSNPECRAEPAGFDWAAYGVRYWRDGILLLEHGYPWGTQQAKALQEVRRLWKAAPP